MNRIVILGAGESGAGAAVLAKKEGMDVFVSDMSKIAPRYKEMLDSHGIAWEELQHTPDLILNADEIIKSPGIPDTAPIVKAAMLKGIGIISEIEFAGRYTKSKMVCITGSNGKTTTTSLIYHIFKKAGADVGLAGNIGHSLALQVAETPHEVYIIELSSFQLDNMYKFRANVSILMNITPDHLDRYNFEMQNYTDSKMRILQNQTADDTFIYWADDPVVTVELPKYKTRVKKVAFDDSDQMPVPVSIHELALPGVHNLYNQKAAALACKAYGLDDDVIVEGLKDFPGVEHRLEKVCCTDGVFYVNDSKATNVDACRWALKAMTTPVVLILGGKDKGNDYSLIYDLVAERCRALVFMGVDNQKLIDSFSHMNIETRDTHSMRECMEACRELAQRGDTVLLSPCCASFDLFKNMEDRGEQFKEIARGE